MKDLFDTLQKRIRPEDVAEMIRINLGNSFTSSELLILENAAQHSFKRKTYRVTRMIEDFKRPIAPKKQVEKACELFRQTSSWSPAEWSDSIKVEQFIRELSPLIRKGFGENDFKSDRLNSEAREKAGLDISKRQYNKLFRFLHRFELKLKTYVREQKKYEYTRIGKSRFVIFLSFDQFAQDANTAAFIAYYTARCSRRSVFSNQGQTAPYDEIADMLFQRLVRHPEKTNWWAVSFIHIDPLVLHHLPDARRGELLGAWLGKLDGIAKLLQEIWQQKPIDRDTMIVAKGHDSTTWNNTANAWNRARASYIALMYSMGLQNELDNLCPVKVLRLIAADVAAWHRLSGKELDPDTKVWAEVPLPWEVLSGESLCTRQQIEEICRRHHVDPVKRGWISPPPGRKIERFEPTPELVHGVEVSNPELGVVLRKAGWFSSKAAKPFAGTEVKRDDLGFALRADLQPIDQSEKER